MDESTLIEDIISLLTGRGIDANEGEGEWPIVVRRGDGVCFGISVEEVS